MAQSETAEHSALVIGAGIIGVCSALYLQREGLRVTLVDRTGPGKGATEGNAGNLGVASCVPASLPGMLPSVPRLLLDPEEPLSVPWARLPSMVPWFLRFALAGRRQRVEEIADARYTLLSRLFDAYDPLLADAGAETLIRRDGLLHIFEDAKYLASSQYVIDLRRRRGIQVREISGDEAREMEPALGPGIVGAVFLPDVAVTVNPLRLAQVLAKSFVRQGGTLLTETVKGFELGAEGTPRVVTDVATHAPDLIVLAAGAWSRPLAAQLGCKLPLVAERGYHVMFPEPGIQLRMCVNSRDRHVAVTPMEHGLRFSSIAEFTDPDAPPNPAHTNVIERKAKSLFPTLNVEGATRWVGPRPSLPDSKPVIGPAPRHPNVLFAFGHDHIGIAVAAITGKLIGELAAGRPPSIDLTPFRPDRF
jgi:D-amino-acid dehydrogenase